MQRIVQVASRRMPVCVTSTVTMAAESMATDVHGVDSICDIKVINLKLHFLLKWSVYDASQNTWEPEEYIMDPALITAFKVKYATSYRDAIAEIDKRKLEKSRKTTNVQEAPANTQRAEVLTRTGRAIIPPRPHE